MSSSDKANSSAAQSLTLSVESPQGGETMADDDSDSKFSRRDFLEVSSGALAGAGVTSVANMFAQDQSKRPASDRSASEARLGMRAASNGVRPPSSSRGSSAAPSGTHTTYFIVQW